MADIDLIPQEYRTWLAQQALLRHAAIAIAVVSALLLFASGGLHFSNASAIDELERLKAENAITQQQQLQLEQLKLQQTDYEKQLSLLHGLRAGAAVSDIFTIVDQALNEGDLWFLEWNFRRAGVLVNGEPRGVETGYFIVVANDGKPAPGQELEVATQMTIRGQARDHQALSTFVRALFEQGDIKDVNVQRTSQALFANRRVVDFVVTVELNSAVRHS